jgi:hypothetical protein
MHDLAFGKEIRGGSSGWSCRFVVFDTVSERFAGQERDLENVLALDYFNARYMAAALGRM